MNKKEVQRFLDEHRDLNISAAKLEYTQYINPNWDKKILEALGNLNIEWQDILDEECIRNTDDPERLLKLMRKQLSGLNRYFLRQRILEWEEKMMPLIKQKLLTNKQDIFIENSLYFFLRCKENTCSWILNNYKNFHSEYLKGLFCLILGFKGEADLIPFLMEEAARMKKSYPDESFDQGPTLAVQELAVRFLN